MRNTTRAKAGSTAIALLLAVSACTGGDEPADSAEEPADSSGQMADDGQPEAATAGERVEVAITDFSYEPETIEVSAGDTVEWTNQDMFAHTVTDAEAEDDGGEFDGQLGDLDSVDAEGTMFERTFDEPGTYAYFCRFHPNMRGTVVVEDA